MKANDMPERIYLFNNPILDFTKLGEKRNDDDIEYTRTDAFIEKVIEWLHNCLDNGMWIANDVGNEEKAAVIESFKEYIKS